MKACSSIISISDITDESNKEEEGQESPVRNLCIVCLTEREATWLFLLCKHANCCTDCSNIITETAQTCPTCRAAIVDKIQIFLKLIIKPIFSFQNLSLCFLCSFLSI